MTNFGASATRLQSVETVNFEDGGSSAFERAAAMGLVDGAVGFLHLFSTDTVDFFPIIVQKIK